MTKMHTVGGGGVWERVTIDKRKTEWLRSERTDIDATQYGLQVPHKKGHDGDDDTDDNDGHDDDSGDDSDDEGSEGFRYYLKRGLRSTAFGLHGMTHLCPILFWTLKHHELIKLSILANGRLPEKKKRRQIPRISSFFKAVPLDRFMPAECKNLLTKS